MSEVERYERIFQASMDAIVVIDQTGSVVALNLAAEAVFECPAHDAVGRRAIDFIPDDDRTAHRAQFSRLVTGDEEALRERRVVALQRLDGTQFPAEIALTQINSNPTHLAVFVRDLTEDLRREQELAQLAHDNALILSSAGDGIIRVDRAGVITYANPAAGSVLDCDPAALIGQGAHNLIHHSHADGSAYPAQLCPIRAAMAGGDVVHVTSEVFWRGDGTSFPVDYTVAPMREGSEVVGAVCVFADITEERNRENELRERAEWVERIHAGLRSGRFVLHAQPIFGIDDQRPDMHELLIRMRPDDGSDTLIPPVEFLGAAERFGLGAEIDRWVVQEAVKLAGKRRVSINLSGQTLGEPGFAEWLVETIEHAAVDPGNLVFEITETAALRDMEIAHDVVERLTARGCGFALDDFGTGYGSFAELRGLPVTHLKIDREFVRNLCADSNDRRTVSAIMAVAQRFGIKTIAEGVEDEETLTFLRMAGVDYAQGFHLGRPAADFVESRAGLARHDKVRELGLPLRVVGLGVRADQEVVDAGAQRVATRGRLAERDPVFVRPVE
jgi:PAS domain S-box-containing protein